MSTYNILYYKNYTDNLIYYKNIKFDYIFINNQLYNSNEQKEILNKYIKIKNNIKLINNTLQINNNFINSLQLDIKHYNIIVINEYINIKELYEFLN